MYEDIVEKWNAQADEFNQWDELGLDEQIEFAIKTTAEGDEEKIEKINLWCEAYPLDAFPEPDFKKAAKILKDHGMTIDSISASNMRHVLKGVKRIIDE